MSRFLALITAFAMALFLAGPAMAQTAEPTVPPWKTISKSYTFNKDVNVTVNKQIGDPKEIRIIRDDKGNEIGREEFDPIEKNVDIDIRGEGNLATTGSVIFKELDVEVQDTEVIAKLFELHDNGRSGWTVLGENGINALEQLQNGDWNVADIKQLATPVGPTGSRNIMNVGLQYQIGASTAALPQTAKLFQDPTAIDTNNFAKQVQIGSGNQSTINQNK